MIGVFVEKQRHAVTRMFERMTAYGIMWDVNWEVACEQASSPNINEHLKELERSSTKREIRCINAAFRREGFDAEFQYLPDNYNEE